MDLCVYFPHSDIGKASRYSRGSGQDDSDKLVVCLLISFSAEANNCYTNESPESARKLQFGYFFVEDEVGQNYNKNRVYVENREGNASREVVHRLEN